MANLSKRMRCVAQMVTPGGCVCDVGCDHGFVSIYLIESGLAKRVIAVDIGEGPLARAKEHIAACGLSDRIETRLSDGLDAISAADGVSSVVMAGMGGPLMEKILRGGAGRGLSIHEFVLQPQSRQDLLRAFLRESGFEIAAEDMVLEDGKFYPVMKVRAPGNLPVAETVSGKGRISGAGGVSDGEAEASENACGEAVRDVDVCDAFGPLLLRQRHPVLLQFLRRQQEKFTAVRQQCLQKGADPSEADRQLALIQRGLGYFM